MAIPTSAELQVLPTFEGLLSILIDKLDNEAKIDPANRLLSTENIANLNTTIEITLDKIEEIINPAPEV